MKRNPRHIPTLPEEVLMTKPMCTEEIPAPPGPLLYKGASMARWAHQDWGHPTLKPYEMTSLGGPEEISDPPRTCACCGFQVPMSERDRLLREEMRNFIPDYKTRDPWSGKFENQE